MDAQEIRAMSDEEIGSALESARQEMFNLRFQMAIGQVSDTSRTRAVRRNVARLQTVRREREIWAAYQAATGEEE